MGHVAVRQVGPDRRCDRASIVPVVDALGTERFYPQLMSLLHDECGADHCTVFEFEAERLERLGSISLDGTNSASVQTGLYLEGGHWRDDPMISEVRRTCTTHAPVLALVGISDLPAGELRDVVYGRTRIKERIMIYGRQHRPQRPVHAFGISVLRSDRQASFTREQVDALQDRSELLISLLDKHAEVGRRLEGHRANLTSLPDIEAKIAAGPESFSRREAQVCARILYGQSTTGIALDIGVGEETVVTYRKRAFLRLGIATRRELLVWFLAL